MFLLVFCCLKCLLLEHGLFLMDLGFGTSFKHCFWMKLRISPGFHHQTCASPRLPFGCQKRLRPGHPAPEGCYPSQWSLNESTAPGTQASPGLAAVCGGCKRALVFLKRNIQKIPKERQTQGRNIKKMIFRRSVTCM